VTDERVVDLDVAKAARLEANGSAPVVRFGGQEFRLRPELADVLVDLADVARLIESDNDTDGLAVGGPLHSILRKSFADDDEYERFMLLRPDWPDLQALASAIPSLYGFGSLGESSESLDTSSNGSSDSKPTSHASTGSTSAPRRTGRAR
jgi:hypothetical protein